jgi:succinate-semialdehyde dehydrogenase / glutarate-semialdehyde dehydrogenase
MTLKNNALFRQAAVVGGRWIEAGDGPAIDVVNPATGIVLGKVPNLGARETREAIEAAKAAMGEWAARTAKERSGLLRIWFDLVIANKDDLAEILTLEQGKPLAEARGEIVYGASFIEWFSEETRRVYGDIIPGHQKDKRILVIKQPIGVVAAITPWNFPNAMITRKVAPALGAGCGVVLKPASQTPFSAIALAILAERAGIPAALFSVVTGDARQIGGELTANPTVRKVTFTGSTRVGAELMRQSAPSIKKMGLELGGNAPLIVFDDADIDAAVEGTIISKFRNNGQTCVCANRIYVQDGVFDAYARKLCDAIGRLKVGNGMEPGVTLGPLIDQAAVEKVAEHIADACAKGATVMMGGKQHELGGTFFQPTVLSDVTSDMLLASEETFGPVAPMFRFREDADVIEKANDTEFGLASYFFSKDLSRVFRVAEALEYGMIGVNTGLISTAEAPFGGVKASGLGREGSRYGLEEFLELKYVCLGL